MTTTPEQRLEALDLALPDITPVAAKLLGHKVSEGLVFVSGQLPMAGGKPRWIGKVGDAVSREDAKAAARLAALHIIGQLSAAADGDLSRIAEIVKVSGFVNCVPDFTDISGVIDGASELFIDVFGDAGQHARFAIGVASLPRGVPVEVDVIARLDDPA